MTNEEAVRRAERAQILLNDEVMVEAFASLETAAMKTLRGSDDRETRDAMYHRLKAIDDIRADLKRIVDAGRLAADRNASAYQNDQARKANGLAPGDIP